MNLYPYQQAAIDGLRNGFMQHQRQLLVLPTGAGKTVVFSTIAEAAVKRGTLTLILTDRTELFQQTVKAVERFGIPVCRIDPDNRNTPPSAMLYIGMVQTVVRRLAQLSAIPFRLIICDEAHMANFNRIFDTWPATRVIGATATPIGKHIYKYYSKMVSTVDTPELVQQQFLTPCRAFQMQDDLSDVTLRSNGEFEEHSLFKHYDKPKLYEGVVDEYLRRTPGQKAIVFNVNVEHTVKMTAAFNSVGVSARCVHSGTPASERTWIMREFAAGSFPVLCNCGILTKGYSEDTIEVVILNRATTSLALYLQMIGRGSRKHPGKSQFTVLDFGLNHTRHGMWNEPRTWSLDPPSPGKKLGAAPVKSCPACEAMLAASSRLCQYCGHAFLPSEKELAQGRMIELTNRIREAIPGRYVSQLTIPELIQCEETGTLKATYVWRVLRSRSATDVGEYARLKNYKDAWIVRQLEAMEAESVGGAKVTFFDKKVNEVPLLPTNVC